MGGDCSWTMDYMGKRNLQDTKLHGKRLLGKKRALGHQKRKSCRTPNYVGKRGLRITWITEGYRISDYIGKEREGDFRDWVLQYMGRRGLQVTRL